MGVLQGSCTSVCNTRCRNRGVAVLILPLPTCASLLSYHLSTSQALIQTSALPSHRTSVHLQSMLLTDNNKKNQLPEPVFKNNSCTGAARTEIKPAPQSLCPSLSSNLYLTLS